MNRATYDTIYNVLHGSYTKTTKYSLTLGVSEAALVEAIWGLFDVNGDDEELYEELDSQLSVCNILHRAGESGEALNCRAVVLGYGRSEYGDLILETNEETPNEYGFLDAMAAADYLAETTDYNYKNRLDWERLRREAVIQRANRKGFDQSRGGLTDEEVYQEAVAYLRSLGESEDYIYI